MEMTVRLSFTQGEHQDFIVTGGEISIGSAPDNQVVLVSDGVAARHAKVIADHRGYLLSVQSKESRTHLNGRPIRETAILRLGDVLSIDTVNILLKADSDDRITGVPVMASEDIIESSSVQEGSSSKAHYRASSARIVLRGVSGRYFGKVVPVYDRLLIGRGSDCDLALDQSEMSGIQVQIEISGQEIFLRDRGSARGVVVNGVQVRDARLFSGDQLTFDHDRFVVEAPGLPTRESVSWSGAARNTGRQPQVTQTMRAIQLSDFAERKTENKNDSDRSEPLGWNPWWLIACAILIAFGVTALLLFR
jgi:pSer/pThr/pTyr-binding forkhead associated (FHA) protein